MREIQPDLHVCRSCGFTAEQITFEMDWDERGGRDD